MLIKALILISVVYSAAVAGDPKITESFIYYDIYPASKSGLGKEMHKQTPIRKNGKRFKGHTHWNVKWKYKWTKRNGLCQVKGVNTTLKVKYTMPRIPKTYSVKKEVLESFENYYSALFSHEKEHMLQKKLR